MIRNLYEFLKKVSCTLVLLALTLVGLHSLVPAGSTQTLRNSDGTYRTNDGALITTFVQPGTAVNSSQTGGAASAVTASIAAVSGQSVHLYSFNAYCSGGTAGVVTVKNAVSGTAIWVTPAALSNSQTFQTPITNASGAGMDIVLGSCGGSYTGTLNVQASQF